MLTPPLQPMLLTSTAEPFDSEDYFYEFKWDGFRSLIFINENKFYIQSRGKKNLTSSFSELKKIRKSINSNQAVLDGEICYFSQESDKKEKSLFSILQKRLQSKKEYLKNKYPVTFVVWDLLSFDGEDIYQVPLYKRKQLLHQAIIKENSFLQLSPYFPTTGKKIYQIADQNGLEGIVAKKKNSPYQFRRSHYWQKIKIWKYTIVTIGGYTIDQSSLLTGKLSENGDLHYQGRVKLSLPEEEKIVLQRFLPDIRIEKSPFADKTNEEKIESDNDIYWVKPVLTCKVKYIEITVNNHFRHGFAIKLILE